MSFALSPVFTRALWCTVAATTSLGALAAAPVHTTASEQARSMDVLRAFDKLCNAPQLTFDVLSARATATGMKSMAAAPAAATGAGKRAGRWGGNLPSGEFALLVDESRGDKGVLTSCAVAAEVGDADVFRSAAIKTMQLRADTRSETGTDGHRSFDFGIVRPPSTRITITDFKPKGLNRVLVAVSTLAPAR